MQQVRNLKKKAKFDFGLNHFFHSGIMPPFPLAGVSVSYRHSLPFFTCTSHSTNETAQTFFLGLPIAKKVFPSCQSRICFQLTWPLGHGSYCHHFSSVVRCPSVNISHFNLLLRNHWANCNQTLVEWSLDGPLSKLCAVIPTSNQDGHQAKNRKKGG